MQTKVLLRKKYRNLRRSIAAEDKIHAACSISNIFLDYLNKEKKIAVYLARDGELDLSFLINELWQQNIFTFLPVIDSANDTLKFAEYSSTTSMQKNYYGIDEPATDFFTPLQSFDIVLLPLVAFNRDGARLGMGKGYYDKALAFKSKKITSPLLIGVAYACQESGDLMADSWDILLDGVLTERELFFVGER